MRLSFAPDPGTRSTSNAGRTTPETFSCFAFTLNDADLTCSCTRYEMSPVAYVTSAMESDASCMTRPILRFAWSFITSHPWAAVSTDWKKKWKTLPKTAHLVDLLQDGPKPCRECVSLLGEQRMAGLCPLETQLCVRERHPRRKDILARSCARHINVIRARASGELRSDPQVLVLYGFRIASPG